MPIFLERDIDLNWRDSNGQTLLGLAAVGGSIKNIDLLLAAGADINAVNRSGETALISAGYSAVFDTAWYLVERGADVRVVDQRKAGIARIVAEIPPDAKHPALQGAAKIRARLIAEGVAVPPPLYRR